MSWVVLRSGSAYVSQMMTLQAIYLVRLYVYLVLNQRIIYTLTTVILLIKSTEKSAERNEKRNMLKEKALKKKTQETPKKYVEAMQPGGSNGEIFRIV